MDARDLCALELVQAEYGGNIHFRSGLNSYRYRQCTRDSLLSLINAVNGHILNPVRLDQLQAIASYITDSGVARYPFTVLTAILTYSSGWLSGMFDADGSISLNASSNFQLAISITNKYSCQLYPLIPLYGGHVYFDRASNSYKWYLTAQSDVLSLYHNYFVLCPPRSLKANRVSLIPRYYELRALRAHLAPSDSPLGIQWSQFLNSWNTYSA